MPRLPAWVFLVSATACTNGGPADADTDRPGDTEVPDDTDLPDDTDPPVVDPETVPLAGPCPLDQALGGFSVVSDDLLSVVAGAVADGVVPLTVLDEVATEGDCTLLRRVAPFCDPPCAADETCGLDSECAPYPTQQDVGTVTVEGLLEPVSMEPSDPGNNYYALGLPHPPYEPGALITLHADGAFFPAFELYGVGLVPLELVPGEWVLDEGNPLEVRWAAPGATVRSTVHLRVTIDQHGTSPLQLDCDFADTGSGTVRASLVDAFVASGVTGFPSATLTRRTVDSLSLAEGCVELGVEWSGPGDLRVEDYTPCTEQADCPPDEICNTALEICE